MVVDKTMTSKIFEPVKLLMNLYNDYATGQLKVSANGVAWHLYLKGGRLQYAAHSLQSLETIEQYWRRLNYDSAIAPTKIVSKEEELLCANDELVQAMVELLLEKNALNTFQKRQLIGELTQDALESFLWLTEAEHEWLKNGGRSMAGTERAVEIPPIVEALELKLQQWRKLLPVISSPYQRLYCTNVNLVQQPVPSGKLSPSMLDKIAKMLKGLSIRQISILLKQDDLKGAQLLYPYIKHKVFYLQPAKGELSKLPIVPAPPVLTSSSNPLVPRGSKAEENNSDKKTKKYKIVCIDDSPTVLNTIRMYLDPERFDFFPVVNPINSLTTMFEVKPDLILMDFSMPGINGDNLCKILRTTQAFKPIPIIMVSGNAGLVEQTKAKNAGITDFLAKPFTKEKLVGMVNKYLELI